MSGFMFEKKIPNLFLFSYDNKLFGLDKNGCGVYEVDSQNGVINLRMIVPDVDEDRPFSRVEVWNDKFVFVPFKHDSVVIFDLKNQSWNQIKIVDDSSKFSKGAFLDALIYEDHLILFPFNYIGIVDVDLNDGKLNEMDLKDICGDRAGDRMTVKHIFFDDGRVLIPVFATNSIIDFCLTNKRIEKIELNDQTFQINSIVKCEDDIILMSRNSLELIMLNKNLTVNKKVKLFDDVTPMGDDITYFDQSGFECMGSNLFCFAARWDKCIMIDLNSFSSSELKSLRSYCFVEGESRNISKFNHGIVIGKNIFIQNHDEKIIEFDMERMTSKVIIATGNDPDCVRLDNFLKSVIKG